MEQFGTHLVSFFTEIVRDYSMLMPDMIRSLGEITSHFERCHRDGVQAHTIMMDPSTQHIENCPKIGTPKFIGQAI